ncbi:MAG TPA: hypothetical protein DHV62_10850, partial [Elusimicrobia bacterium]|nr:hypothetical protein [Elusimicrobiota bacterium]
MKKLLVVANLYHASPRIPGIATYLPEFGWEATIVTPPLGSDAENRLGFPKRFLERTKIVEAPYKGDIFWFWRKIFQLIGFKMNESITEQIKENVRVTSKKSFIDILMNWYQTFFAYPDTEKTWEKPALKSAYTVIEKEHFDAILSSSPFPTSHIVAAELKKKFSLPWLADFRDLWTQNHNYSYNYVRKYFEKKLERKTLSISDTIVVATPPLAKQQQYFLKKPAITITNGFDPENRPSNFPVILKDKFTITYTGPVYIGKQDPEKLLAVIKKLILEKIIEPNRIEVRFYGPRIHWLDNKIIEYNLGTVVKQYGLISRYESIQRQRESHVLLLLNWEDPGIKGVYTVKFFEYLSAQRPILVTGGFLNGIENLITETGASVC